MRAVGIYAFRVEQSGNQLRALLQPQEVEFLMLDIFDMKSAWEMYWENEIVGWQQRFMVNLLTTNLKAWSF